MIPIFHSGSSCNVSWKIGTFTVWDTVLIQCAYANHPSSKSPDTPWRSVYYMFPAPAWFASIYQPVLDTIGRPPLGSLLFARVFKQTYDGSRSPCVTFARAVM